MVVAVALALIDELRVVPRQKDASAAAISVAYTVTASNGQTTFTGTKKVALKNSTAWGEGKKIRYTLTLPTGADAISFTPTVGGWTDDSREESAE